VSEEYPTLWQRIKGVLRLVINWRFVICFGIAWIITNGWSYLLLAIGTLTKSAWMMAVSGAYITFLWLPISPEKVVTCAIALGLVRLLFPRHQAALSAQVRLVFQTKRKKKNSKKALQKEDPE
jgi:hypothetical protein